VSTFKVQINKVRIYTIQGDNYERRYKR
jgi:hypothetical protein